MEFLDLKAQYHTIKKEINTAIQKVLNQSHFILGEEVQELEKQIAKYCGVKYAIGVNSGTDALLLSLMALNIGPNDEVITTPFTFIATAEVIALRGAKPVFVDIEKNTFNIDPELIEKSIASHTKAIIPVHLYGQPAEMDKIMKIAKKYKLYVVEDAAQAIGAKCQMANGEWQITGSIGDIGCLSFFPSKNLGAYGDGGMVITNNKKLADKIRLLRTHGSSIKQKYLNLILGTNSRLDSIQAAILRVKLKYLESWSKTRAEKAKLYEVGLRKIMEIRLPYIASDNTHIFHQYTIRTKLRDELQEYLRENNIPTMIYYPLPLHLQPALKYLGYKKGDFPEAERTAKEVLSLPIYPELSKQDQDFIVQKIREFYEKKN